MRQPIFAALLAVALAISACGLRIPSGGSSPTATTGHPASQLEVSFTQVGNSLSVRLRNPNSDVGLVRSPFELAMLDQTGAVIGTEGQGGIPGTAVNTIYQLPPGGEYGLDTATVPNGKAVASVELTVLGQWLKWDTVNPPTVTVTDATVLPETGHIGPSATGRLILDKDGPLNVVVQAFVKTPVGMVISRVFVDCVQTSQPRTFQTKSFADARGPYELDKVVAYATSVEGAGPRYKPNCSAAPAATAPVATVPEATSTPRMCQGPTECDRGNDSGLLPGAGPCSVDIPGCEGYAECHPVVTGNRDCFPENESCSKPGNTFPWCATPTTSGAVPLQPQGFVAPGTHYAFPGHYSPQSPAQERPTYVALNHRFYSLSNLTWTTWGPEGADGSGQVLTQTNCDPTCAEGTRYTDTVEIHASHPQPPPASSGCPNGALFYTDVVLSYPNGSTAPRNASGGDFQWTTVNGVEAIHYWNRVPTCEP